MAPGVPALKRSLVDLILAGKFADLGELPPARGYGKTPAALTSDVEGKIVLLQAADYVRSKKHIPDLATWMQCFAIYSAVLLTKYPERAQSLLMYSAVIARLSKKFRWLSWIIYGQYFRQEAADTGKTDWSTIDSSIHTQCFTGMSLSAEGWCSICTSMDHTIYMPLSHPRRVPRLKEANSKNGAVGKESPSIRQVRRCLPQVEQVPLHELPPRGLMCIHT